MTGQRLGLGGVPRGCNRATPAALNVVWDLAKRGKAGLLAAIMEEAMPDLFPTTDEAEKDQNIADAAAGETGIVNHLGPDSFEKDGLRPFFEYRPLGLKELTGGKIGAHVIRAKPGQHADAPRHTHALEFQFVYVLKGWAIFDYEGYGEHKLVAGSTVYQPPGIKHKEIDHSEDFEVLEITMPADFETKEVK
jgi:quercetin dioxygenase-like cupin family protein